MSRNLGQSTLRRKRRSGDPMPAYDGLPPPLRQWLSAAALPWSPTSARRLWFKLRSKGLTQEEMIVSLSEVEARTLARDRHSILFDFNPQN
jgi:hypothetical protein